MKITLFLAIPTNVAATASATVASLLVLLAGAEPARAQLAVYDPAVHATTQQSAWNNAWSYLKQGDQWLKQVDQYLLQGQQYAAQMQNLLNLPNQVYADVMSPVNQTMGLVSSVPTGVPPLPNFQNNFQNFNSWNSRPVTLGGYRQSMGTASLNEIAAYVGAAENLIRQGESMMQGAQRLQQMVTGSQAATGNLQALKAQNQLTSAQIAELQQIRGLLMHQLEVTNARNASLANREAAQEAAAQQMLQFNPGNYTAVPINMSMR